MATTEGDSPKELWVSTAQLLLDTAPILAGALRTAADQRTTEPSLPIAPVLQVVAGDLDFIVSAINFLDEHEAPAKEDLEEAKRTYFGVLDDLASLIDPIITPNIARKAVTVARASQTRFYFPPEIHPSRKKLCMVFCYSYGVRQTDARASNYDIGTDADIIALDISPRYQSKLLHELGRARTKLFNLVEWIDSTVAPNPGVAVIAGAGTPSSPDVATWELSAHKQAKRQLTALGAALRATWPEVHDCPECSREGQAGRPQHLRHAMFVNLLLDTTWSRTPTNLSSFDLVVTCECGFQEAEVLFDHQINEPVSGASLRACCIEINAAVGYTLRCSCDGLLSAHGTMLFQHRGPRMPWDSAREFRLDHVIRCYELDYKEKMLLCLKLARALIDLPDVGLLQEDWGITDITVYGCKQGHDMKLDIRSPYLKVSLPGPPREKKKRDTANKRKKSKSTDSEDGKRVFARIKRENYWHHFPYALGLGIVLMQILLGDRLDMLEEQRRIDERTVKWSLYDDVKGNVNEKWQQADRLRRECQKRFPPASALWKPIYDSIKIMSLFDTTSAADFHQVLRDQVIFPFEKAILNDYGLEQSLADLDNFTKEEPSGSSVLGDMSRLFSGHFPATPWIKPSVARALSSAGERDSTEGVPLTLEPSGTTLAIAMSKLARTKEFLKPITTIQTEPSGLFTLNRMDEDSFSRDDYYWNRLIRVAILDTGCDSNDPEIERLVVGHDVENIAVDDRRPGIVGWHDFLNENAPASSFVDESPNRHGTLMAHLFLKTMPMAKVFVGRVMKQSSSYEDNAAAKVAQAVKHAAQKWKADIISISLSLSTDAVTRNKETAEAVESLRTAIEDVGNQCLIFAAAGNNKLEVAWPARMTEVIAVFSHNSHGKDSKFSPNPRPDDPNFAVPGEDLEGLVLGPGRDIVHGTSCATPIAAGIGALVLDFVRCYWDQLNNVKGASRGKRQPNVKKPVAVEREARLRKLEVMKNIFEREARLRKPEVMKNIFWWFMVNDDRKIGVYNVLQPKLLFPTDATDWADTAAGRLREILEKQSKSTLKLLN